MLLKHSTINLTLDEFNLMLISLTQKQIQAQTHTNHMENQIICLCTSTKNQIIPLLQIKEIPKEIAKRSRTFSSVKLFLLCQYIQTHSKKEVSKRTLHLSKKPPTPRRTRKSDVSVKSDDSILHIVLVLKQMLEGYS